MNASIKYLGEKRLQRLDKEKLLSFEILIVSQPTLECVICAMLSTPPYSPLCLPVKEGMERYSDEKYENNLFRVTNFKATMYTNLLGLENF